MRLPGYVRDLLRFRHEVRYAIGKRFVIDRGQIASCGSATEVLSYGDRHRVYAFSRAHLIGSRSIPVSRNHAIVAEHIAVARQLLIGPMPLPHTWGVIRDSFRAPDRTIRDCFSINSPLAFNYYHWMTDLLPTLRGYEMLPEPRPKLLVPPGMAKWQIRSLELMGYPQGSYEQPDVEHIVADRLYVARWSKLPGFDEAPSADDVQWVRERKLQNAAQPSRAFSRRLFVSRSDSRKPARIANESAVASLLERYGFETFVPSAHSIDDQIAAFANAELIVGAHGAGLTTLIFARGATIVELWNREPDKHHFSKLANAAGTANHRFCVIGDTDDARNLDVLRLVIEQSRHVTPCA
jgi:capsular polysaccharide biosynthesis protein